MKKIVLVLLPLIIACAQSPAAGYTRYSDRDDVRRFVDRVVTEYQFNRAELLGLFRDIEPQQKVLDTISRPAERVLTWKEYRPIFLDGSRIKQGVEFWQAHRVLLQQAEHVYGVPPEIIVAIIGVETKYGKISGGYRVLPVLLTLGFDYPPRQDFFRSELEHFLLLAREEQFDLREVSGSYATAMGMPQFIASSYRRYAVDFDQDGRRDLWHSHADIIGSVAHYFKQHGWQHGAPVVLPARVQEESRALAVGNGRKGLRPELTLQDYAKLNIYPLETVQAPLSAVLLYYDGAQGDEYWLGFENFYTITRYNHSSMYAMAVYQLSREIAQAYHQAAQPVIPASAASSQDYMQ